MPHPKLRIKIKELPKDFLISDEEKKKIKGGGTTYMNAIGYMNYVNIGVRIPFPGGGPAPGGTVPIYILR